MAKLVKQEVLEELVEGRQLVYDTIDKQLENVKITKEQLEKYREELKKYPDYIIEREIQLIHIRKKLNIVLGEKQLIDKLDVAIDFLQELINTKSTD